MTAAARSHDQQQQQLSSQQHQHQHHHRQRQRQRQRQHLSGNSALLLFRGGLPLLLSLVLFLVLALAATAPGAEARNVAEAEEDSDHLLLRLPASSSSSSSTSTTTPAAARGAQTTPRTLAYLRKTLRALGDALGFFHRHHAHVNLDGIIGTRIVEGTLKVLLANVRSRGQMAMLPVDIARDLQSVHQLATVVSDESEPYIAINEAEYFNRIWPTVHGGTWELNYPWRNLSSTVPTWPFSLHEAMEEEESDDCLTELFGTTGKTKKTCVISDQCWSKMTKMGYHMYSLSHQIFYLQLGECSGCLSEIQQRIRNNKQPSLRELQDTFCANMLRESRHLARQGYPANFRDLFMEQAGLCGMYGYWQFFRYSWLDRMLSWQDSATGCYRNDDWPRYVDEHRGRRVKREELRLDNGCLSHMTAVASAGLSQYVRFLTEAFLLTTTTTTDHHRHHQHQHHIRH